MLAAALQYARLGWYVLPLYWPVFAEDGSVSCACRDPACSSIGKHPHGWLARRGLADASCDEDVIRGWFERAPNINIGINNPKSGILTVDIDPRNGGALSIEILEAQHGPIRSNVTAITGGGGEHRVFAAPENLGAMPGRLGKGIDVKANGFVVVEPSMHASGRRYEWEGSSDPREYAVPSALPDWLRDLANVRQVAEPVSRSSRFVTPEQIEELRSALTVLDADDYHQWINCGFALKSIGGAGLELWDEWSQQSAKYKAHEINRKWRKDLDRRPDGPTLNLESIFFWAQEQGWVNPLAGGELPEPAPVPFESVRVFEPEVVEHNPQSGIKPIPGMLGKVFDWIEKTAFIPDELLSTQAALSFGTTICGRRYRTRMDHWPTLFFLNLAPTGGGKEHGRTSQLRLHAACGTAEALIGPKSYASASALISALYERPSHIAFIDEFAWYLQEARSKNGTNTASMFREMMEMHTQCKTSTASRGLSTLCMSEQDRKASHRYVVEHPALTVFAMSSPDMFYKSVGSSAIANGFLNRFIVAESVTVPTTGIDFEKIYNRDLSSGGVPSEIVEWATWARESVVDSALLAGVDLPNALTGPKELDVAPDALRAMTEWDYEMRVKQADKWRPFGLADTFIRVTENAQRMAIPVAVSCQSDQITRDHFEWCAHYVFDRANHFADRIITCLSESDFEAACQEVRSAITAAGRRGLTDREIYKKCGRYRALDMRGQKGVRDMLRHLGEVEHTIIPRDILNARGPQREAWVRLAQDEPGGSDE